MCCGTAVGYVLVCCGTAVGYVLVCCGTAVGYVLVCCGTTVGCFCVLWNSCRSCFGVLCGFVWFLGFTVQGVDPPTPPPPPLNYMPQTKCSCRHDDTDINVTECHARKPSEPVWPSGKAVGW